MLIKNYQYIIAFFIILICSSNSFADNNFNKWLEDFKKEALSKGISKNTLKVLENAKPIKKTIKLDRNQPEFKLTFPIYKNKIISDFRIKKAKSEYKKNKLLLDEIEKKYNVNGRLIIALWAIESNFGNNMGKFNLFHTLSSLAFDGRRSKFFRSELFNALMIVENKMVKDINIKSGWAGAMGQCQFMPSSYLSYAVDGNNDGEKDIWNNKEDVFASMANYLKKNGWNNKYLWGREVKNPSFDDPLIYNKKVKKLFEWKKLGFKKNNGSELPDSNIKAKLLVIDKSKNNMFLVYDNFDTILKWNRSNYFALSVGILSDYLVN